MPYVESWGLTPPDETSIWRYMDLPRLVSLLSTRALFFARADTLEDSLEGSRPPATLTARRIWYEERAGEQAEDAIRRMAEEGERWRRRIAVNCWHASAVESIAMWKVYGRVGESVAIRSTVGRLKAALAGAPEAVRILRVQYVDYATAALRHDNYVEPFFTKELSFIYENEVRALFKIQPGQPHGEWWDDPGEIPGRGIAISVDPAALVEALVISPTAPAWFTTTVEAVATVFGYNGEIVQSRLAVDPVY